MTCCDSRSFLVDILDVKLTRSHEVCEAIRCIGIYVFKMPCDERNSMVTSWDVEVTQDVDGLLAALSFETTSVGR